MTRQARPDLRERMQRVAAKPAEHPDTARRTRTATPRSKQAATSRRKQTATPRSKQTATPRRTEAATPRKSAAAPRRTDAAEPLTQPAALDVDPGDEFVPEADGKTRVETLAGWFMWEIASVPRKRLRFLKEFLLGS